jgi:hypothetical protein
MASRIKKVMVIEDANSITKGIVNQLLSEGHSARRINTMGVWDEKKKLWRRAAQTGTADILACIAPNGRFLAIEVKFGKDTQRNAQKEYQDEVNGTGGTYLIIKAWEDWLFWWSKYKESYL